MNGGATGRTARRWWWAGVAVACAVVLSASSCTLVGFPATGSGRILRTVVTFYDDLVVVEVDPPLDRPVDTTPLYRDGRCITS